MNDKNSENSENCDKQIPRIVVRLQTDTWENDRGLHVTKNLSFLKRQCQGHNYVLEDCRQCGCDITIGRFTNLDKCPDGTYQVTMTDLEIDEGYVEDYSLTLVPYTIPPQSP